MCGEEVADLPARLVLGGEAQVEVRPVEAVDDGARRSREKLGDDVAPRGGIGGGGERDHLDAAERLAEAGERPVFGAEVVAPLRYAVRLVDGEALDAGRLQRAGEGGIGEALGRDVEEAERALLERARPRPTRARHSTS